jgi:hypothetical protein
VFIFANRNSRGASLTSLSLRFEGQWLNWSPFRIARRSRLSRLVPASYPKRESRLPHIVSSSCPDHGIKVLGVVDLSCKRPLVGCKSWSVKFCSYKHLRFLHLRSPQAKVPSVAISLVLGNASLLLQPAGLRNLLVSILGGGIKGSTVSLILVHSRCRACSCSFGSAGFQNIFLPARIVGG